MSKVTTVQEFGIQLAPLMNKWRTAYNGDVIKGLHEKFKFYSMESVKKAVDHLLINSRVAPLEADFKAAFITLNIRQEAQPNYGQHAAALAPVEDITYHLTNNVWANKTHIFIRGKKVPAFIIKDQHPENEYVRLDKAIGAVQLMEAQEHLRSNTYGNYVAEKNVPRGTESKATLRAV